MAKKVWMYSPTPKKLKDTDKFFLKNKVMDFIGTSEKLLKIINRVEVRAGRVYFYHLVEQFGWDDPGAKFISPLIDGKYAEFPYARITAFNNGKFSLSWQRHTGQWVEFFEDTLEACLKYIDEDDAHFF